MSPPIIRLIHKPQDLEKTLSGELLLKVKKQEEKPEKEQEIKLSFEKDPEVSNRWRTRTNPRIRLYEHDITGEENYFILRIDAPDEDIETQLKVQLEHYYQKQGLLYNSQNHST